MATPHADKSGEEWAIAAGGHGEHTLGQRVARRQPGQLTRVDQPAGSSHAARSARQPTAIRPARDRPAAR